MGSEMCIRDSPSWLPASWGALWVIGHGTICVVLGLSLAGAEKLDLGREH